MSEGGRGMEGASECGWKVEWVERVEGEGQIRGGGGRMKREGGRRYARRG